MMKQWLRLKALHFYSIIFLHFPGNIKLVGMYRYKQYKVYIPSFFPTELPVEEKYFKMSNNTLNEHLNNK